MKQVIFLSLLVLFLPAAAFATPYDFDVTLKQQINEHTPKNEILCQDDSHVLVERTNNNLACVFLTTAEKLQWELVYDEIARHNLIIHNDPDVKDCTIKGPRDAWVSYPYQNTTHSFDVEFCVWNLNN